VVAEADPAEQFTTSVVARPVLAEDAERQGDVLEGGQVVEQAEILEDDADPAADRRQVGLGQRRGVPVEHGYQAAGRFHREEDEADQRGLAGAGRPGGTERARANSEAEVPENLRPHL
jgi:hypothetical protein